MSSRSQFYNIISFISSTFNMSFQAIVASILWSALLMTFLATIFQKCYITISSFSDLLFPNQFKLGFTCHCLFIKESFKPINLPKSSGKLNIKSTFVGSNVQIAQMKGIRKLLSA